MSASPSTAPPGVRDRILDAAVDLLARHGPRALAQPQVAREAGVPQGHLTYYFPKKVDLVLAVAGRMRELLAAEVAPLLAEAGAEGFERRFLSLGARLAQNRGRTRMLLALLAEIEHEPSVRAHMQEGFVQLRRAFGLAMGRKEDDPDIDLVIATLWGLGLQHLLLEGRRTDEDTARLFDRLAEGLDRPFARR
jgi:AcrR family transcriptional regulator